MPPMMTGSSFGACLRISASSAAMSDRRLSSTAAMYSAGVFTFSCPFIFLASSQTRRHQTGSAPATDELSHDGVGPPGSYGASDASMVGPVADWQTISSLATAGGTLVLAAATFS